MLRGGTQIAAIRGSPCDGVTITGQLGDKDITSDYSQQRAGDGRGRDVMHHPDYFRQSHTNIHWKYYFFNERFSFLCLTKYRVIQ